MIGIAAPAEFVGFIFAYVRKQPRTPEELQQTTSLLAQQHVMRIWADNQNRKPVRIKAGWTTYRARAFVDVPEFTAVMKLAAERSCPLVLADIEGLLRRTKPELITRCLDALGACLVPVIDAKTNRDWHFISGEEKTRMAATAMNVFADRSAPIRQSLGKSRSAVPRPPGKGHRVGARVNAVNADKRASELATFVAALRSRLPEGVALSPAELARALNEAGIKPARAAKWTYQTAKDLLKRSDALQKTTD